MSKHTPGPWWIDKHSVNCAYCEGLHDERECVRNFNDEGSVCPSCHKKMVSAPELLEALQTEHNANIRAGHHQTTCETCLLIAKAEGK